MVVTKHHFDKLEEDVKKLRRKVKELAELPANSALIDVLRYLSNLFQTLNY